MRAVLTIETGHGSPRVCSLEPGQVATLGRQRGNVVVLNDEHVSRRHAEVYCDAGRWFVRDCGGTNGTAVDGTPVQERAPLEHNQLITIARTALRFSLQAPANGSAAVPEARPPSAVLDDPRSTVLCKDELALLCRFMTLTLNETDRSALLRQALETVLGVTGARVAGFVSLEADDPGPHLLVPEQAPVDTALSRALTQAVQAHRRTVWMAAEPDLLPDSESLHPFTDAVGIPLLAEGAPQGAVHAYRTGRRFTEREVRSCEILAAHLAGLLHLLRVRRSLEAENTRLRSHTTETDELIGTGPALQVLRRQIEALARGSSPVLVTGESGAGKELVAVALHRQSPRHDGPLVTVNCAAMSHTLLESELFGHVKGAFTGAHANHPGYFEQADGGTLFLDEVGELSPECQGKLLRVLEGKGFRRVGGTSEVRVDVRIVAATNRDLSRAVRDGRFRQDLYYRLQGLMVRVPPLREHPEDIPELARHFLARFAAERGRAVRWAPEALEKLKTYPWPGNVRQLRSVVESTLAMTDRDVLEAGEVALPAEAAMPGDELGYSLDEVEAWAVRRALAHEGGNITRAARLLGISRETLSVKMKKYGVPRGSE